MTVPSETDSPSAGIEMTVPVELGAGVVGAAAATGAAGAATGV